MKRTYYILLIAFLPIILFQCGSEKKATATAETATSIVIFGSSECDHCTDFMAQLDSIGLKYTFNNLVDNQAHEDAMFAKVQQFNYTEYINIPVVVVNDAHFFSQPELEEVMNVLK